LEVLFQYGTINIRFVLTTFEEGAGNGLLQLTAVSHVTNSLAMACQSFAGEIVGVIP
jgi:hypothetical protein